MYLSLYCNGAKRVTQGFMVRGSWRPNITAIFWPRLLWLSALCLSRSPGLLTGGPGTHSAGFLYNILSKTSLDPNSSGAPRAPSAWCDFPYHISSITHLISNCLTSVLTELYNSSTPTQSSTRSLEWHVWSSSSGNNCHAVHRSLSSGASVDECTMGILACLILLANFRPRDFLS